MNTEIENAIHKYIKENIAPKEPEKKNVQDKYADLQGKLEGRTFQSGSYARFTAITPVNDLDVIYVLKEDIQKAVSLHEIDLDDVLNSLCEAIKKEYGNSVKIKKQTHSVGIYFGAEDEFSIDLVPAIAIENDQFKVPEENNTGIEWIKSDPKGYIEEAKTMDEQSGGIFRRSTKLLKSWKYACKYSNENFPLKSFHIEQIIVSILRNKDPNGCFELVEHFFDSLNNYISRPQITDKADSSRYIDAYVGDLSSAELEVLNSEIEKAKGIITQLKDRTDENEINELISELTTPSVPTALATTQEQTLFIPESVREHGGLQLGDYSHMEQVEWKWPVNIQGTVTIDGYAYDDKNRSEHIFSDENTLYSKKSLKFVAIPENISEPFEVYWQVVNTGDDVIGDPKKQRGKIEKSNTDNKLIQEESTLYTGKHWIECFIIKKGECVARSGRFYVNIINLKTYKKRKPYFLFYLRRR